MPTAYRAVSLFSVLTVLLAFGGTTVRGGMAEEGGGTERVEKEGFVMNPTLLNTYTPVAHTLPHNTHTNPRINRRAN